MMFMGMDRLFSLDMPFVLFVRNVLFASLAGLIPVLLLFVLTRDGFAGMLLHGGPPLSRFLRQVITNGLPVVFTVNYISFFLYACMTAPSARGRDAAVFVLIDIPARLAAFILLHAAIYVLSADWFGSFGGSRMTALGVVAPTLARSALFENISGAYLYATLVGALPLYVAVIDRSPLLGSLARRIAGRFGSILFALGIFAGFVLLLTVFTGLVAHMQTSG